MQTDESGAPWPYERTEDRPREPPSKPTWECPEGICECHGERAPLEPVAHRITLFDELARRMPGARCRVLENGKLLNGGQPFAGPDAAVAVRIRTTTRALQLEWAPGNTPRESRYPYRRLYHVAIPDDVGGQVEKRLGNIGYCARACLEDNVADFQCDYGLPETGDPNDVASRLAQVHDAGLLAPRGGAQPGAAAVPRPPAEVQAEQPASPPRPTGGAGQLPSGSAAPTAPISARRDPEPPRLSVAINATATSMGDPHADLDALGRPSLSAIRAIIEHINGRATSPEWDDIWQSESLTAPNKTWRPQPSEADEAEEQWARAVEELFLGSACIVPGAPYDLHPSGPALSPEGWTPFIYSRIQRYARCVFERRNRRGGGSWGSCYSHSWKDPSPVPESEFPRYCAPGTHQPGKAGPLERVAGQWRLVPDPPGPRWVLLPNADPAVPLAVACQHFATYLTLTRGFRVEHVGYQGYQPGKDHTGLPIFGPNVAPTSYLAYELPYLEEERAGEWGSYTCYPPNPGRVAPGALYVFASHVRCVARVNAAGARLQCLESHTPGPHVPQYVFEQYNAPMAGGARTSVPEQGMLLGRGLLPAWTPVPLDVMGAHLRRARPVGLMRLVVATRRPRRPGGAVKVVYVSPIVLAYGNDPRQNMTMARMLWAVRGTPGFGTLQPHVLLYAPRGHLARAMWAPDAREMSLQDYVHRYRPPAGIVPARDMRLLTDATNNGDLGPRAASAGSALWRTVRDLRSSEDISKTVAKAAAEVVWNQEWLDVQSNGPHGGQGSAALATHGTVFGFQA